MTHALTGSWARGSDDPDHPFVWVEKVVSFRDHRGMHRDACAITADLPEKDDVPLYSIFDADDLEAVDADVVADWYRDEFTGQLDEAWMEFLAEHGAWRDTPLRRLPQNGDTVRIRRTGEIGTMVRLSIVGIGPYLFAVELHTQGPAGTRGNLIGWWHSHEIDNYGGAPASEPESYS